MIVNLAILSPWIVTIWHPLTPHHPLWSSHDPMTTSSSSALPHLPSPPPHCQPLTSPATINSWKHTFLRIDGWTNRPTDGQNDRQTDPLIEMQGCTSKPFFFDNPLWRDEKRDKDLCHTSAHTFAHTHTLAFCMEILYLSPNWWEKDLGRMLCGHTRTLCSTKYSSIVGDGEGWRWK